MNWYLKALKKSFDFEGRARRKEFWLFYLINSIVLLVLELAFMESSAGIVLTVLYSLFICIPSLSLSIRRLHDVNKSGFWLFINFVPVIGSIWLFILSITDSYDGVNDYGNNPKSYAY